MKKTKYASMNFERLECRRVFAATPIITEFMASNDGALLDGYGAEQDWVEIFNPGESSVNLADFKLTDDPEKLSKWSFPSMSLEPGQYLVVFASSRDEVDPAGHIHTNFSLSADGEYLALVNPLGEVISEFGPSFPGQESNGSYGIGFNSESRLAVGPGSSAGYLLPVDGSVDTSWMLPEFDDSAWSVGTASLGYQASNGPYAGLYQTALPGGTRSAYVRIPFTVDQAGEVAGTLRMKYDDGFVAYLNGVEIARRNAPSLLSFDAYATEFHPQEAAIVDHVLSIENTSNLLTLGENVLAIHLLNAANSPTDDLLLAPTLILSSGVPIAPTVIGSMMAPTPGAPNTNIQAGEVLFSRVGGVFNSPFALELMSSSPDEQIRYTLNGTDPSADSLIYTGPININSSVQVRARAFGPNGQVGRVRAEGYTSAGSQFSDFTSDLPIIVLDNFGGGRPDREFEDAMFSLYEVDPTTDRSALTDLPTLTSPVGHHRRGSSTYNLPKSSLRLEFRNEQGEQRDVDLLGMPSESDWILYAPYSQDRSMIRNAVMFDLSGQMGDYAIRTRFVEVFYNYNGGELGANDYVGVYVLMENIKRDDNRVAIDALSPADLNEPEITGGYIIKIDRREDSEDASWDSPGAPQSLEFLGHVDPKRSELTQVQVDYLRGYIDDFETVLFGPNSKDPNTGYAAYIDVDSFIDHHLLRAFSREKDMLALSEYYFKPQGGKLTAGPVWDFDRSSGSEGGSVAEAEGWILYGTNHNRIFNYGWWGPLFKDLNFKQKWIDRWQELRETVFSDSNLADVVLSHSAELDESQARNAIRWSAMEPNGGIYADEGLEGWEAEISNLKNWLQRRAAWIDDQFVSPPTIAIQPQGNSGQQQVSITYPSGSIYYTLDGSDPRASGGGISPAALLYTEPFEIGGGVHVNARAFDSFGHAAQFTPWSRLESEASALETSFPLRIVELMYNPPGSADDTEYFELLNMGTEPIQLAGVKITEFSGGGFTFASGMLPPGERIVVVKDQAAFAAAYPGVTNIASGEFSGSLSNEGELVGLLDPEGTVIQWFIYGDSNVSGWPELPDGEGYSLEYIGPLNAGEDPLNGSPDDPFDNSVNWRTSLQEGGSPGVDGNPVLSSVADFDGDGDVDGRDFLLWQRGFGKTPASKADGDSDNDGDVDGNDLVIWQEQYSQPTSVVGAIASDSAEGQEQTAAIESVFWIPAGLTVHQDDPDDAVVLEFAPDTVTTGAADVAFTQLGGAQTRRFTDFGDIAVTRTRKSIPTQADGESSGLGTPR
jgi:hypothetical protein